MRTRLAIAAVPLLALSLAGCGGGSSSAAHSAVSTPKATSATATKSASSSSTPTSSSTSVLPARSQLASTDVTPHTMNPLDLARALQIPDVQHQCWGLPVDLATLKESECTMLNPGSVDFKLVTFKNKKAGATAMGNFVSLINQTGGTPHGIWNVKEGWGFVTDGQTTDAKLLGISGPGARVYHVGDMS